MLLWLACQCLNLFAQRSANLAWWDPAKNEFPVLEGQGWFKEVKEPYSRLPASSEKQVNPAIWKLSRQSAGLMLRFKSNASHISIRYTVGGPHALPHMPATGVSGVDLYAVNADGEYLWCAGKFSFKDTITYQFTNLEPSDKYHNKGREYRLYLPLYNSVKWLEVGVPEEAAFTALPVREDKPIVVYGTSIAQGACASRPGMAWTSIVGRKMDRPLLNLGFSGNGRLDKEIIDLVTEIDARVYILDCLPNMVGSSVLKSEEVYSRIIDAVKTIRQKKPNVPIILTEHAGYTDGGINPARRKLYTDVNEQARKAFTDLRKEDIASIYLLPQSELSQDIETMVDGTHPNDLGMLRYATGYEKIVRQVLQEPAAAFSTTQPKTQTRDAKYYDWEKRHREILTLNKSQPPQLVFIGNSIIHYWGGIPVAPRSSGAASWKKIFEPQGARNLGFGWDRIENVLWRIYHDELDGFALKQAVILIGTNNLELNSDAEIVAGLKLLVESIKIRQPNASVLLMGLLPRRNQEERVSRINQEIKKLAASLSIPYQDAGPVFLDAAGKINEALFSDGLHPNALGYERLANYLKPFL